MRGIIDFYSDAKPLYYMSPAFLTINKYLPANVDPIPVLSYLVEKEYIRVNSDSDGSHVTVHLLSAGKTYFEDKSDRLAERRQRNLHDWLIAIFSALIGAIASEPLWAGIHHLLDLIHQTP